MTVNGKSRRLAVAPDTPLLWALRDGLKLTGTKFGCGSGLCGSCTVLMDGGPVRSCVLPVAAVGRAKITTIEGLAATPLARVQQAWIDAQVPQCGYCQPGMIMAVAGLLSVSDRKLTAAELTEQLTNICRCGSYGRAAQAIKNLTTEQVPA